MFPKPWEEDLCYRDPFIAEYSTDIYSNFELDIFYLTLIVYFKKKLQIFLISSCHQSLMKCDQIKLSLVLPYDITHNYISRSVIPAMTENYMINEAM